MADLGSGGRIFCGSMIWWTTLVTAARHLRGRITNRTLRRMNHVAGIRARERSAQSRDKTLGAIHGDHTSCGWLVSCRIVGHPVRKWVLIDAEVFRLSPIRCTRFGPQLALVKSPGEAKMAAAMNVGPMDVFWLFLMLISLQPVVKQRWLEASRRMLIARLERKRHSR